MKEAIELSERLGVPFRDLIERILASYLEASKTNPHLINAIYELDLIEDIRRVGGVILPQSFVYKFLEKLSEEELEILKEELRKTASWVSLLAKVKRGESIEIIARILRIWFPDFKVDLISVNSESKMMKIVISSPSHSDRVFELVEAVIDGVIKSFDAIIYAREYKRGVLSIVIKYG